MKRTFHSQFGSMTLFMAVILLPIVFFLLTLSLDLTELYSHRAATQRLIDEAALYGYRFLPYQARAAEAIEGYLDDLNRVTGTYKSLVSSDGIEIVYQGTSPFRFAAFAGYRTGMPYEVHTRVRGTVMHTALVIDSGAELAPAEGAALWGEEGKWPSAHLFEKFHPFGEGVSARAATQQCFNPLFTGLKRNALRIFDYLTSFRKNSVAVSFVPGTLDLVDTVKDARRSGSSTTGLSTSYFNTANGRYSQNGFCLASLSYEGLESVYRLPAIEEFGVDFELDDSPLTDTDTHLVSEEDLSEISVRQIIWSRGVRAGIHSVRALLSRATELLAAGGELNAFQQGDQLAAVPVKTAVIFSARLPTEGSEVFPAEGVKDALRFEIGRFDELLLGSAGALNNARRAAFHGALYFVILDAQPGSVTQSTVEELQQFFNKLIEELNATERISIRVVFSSDVEGLAQGVLRSIVLESNTGVVDG